MNNNHDYDKISSELYAKYILEALYPSRYRELIRTDRPDLISEDRSIGIEVTRVLWDKEMKSVAFFNTYLKDRQIDNIDSQIIESFVSYGNEVLTGARIKSEWTNKIIGFSPSIDGTNYSGFKKLLIKKHERISSKKYIECDQYDLFITWGDLFEDEVDEALNIIKEINDQYTEGYTFVVLDTANYLYKYDIDGGIIEKKYTRDHSKNIIARIRAEIS